MFGASSLSAEGSLWARWPAAHVLFAALALLVLVLAAVTDRTFLIDQQNYIDNFAYAANLEWLDSRATDDSLTTFAVLQLFSEEILWRLWASALGSLVNPGTAVLITVCLLNLLVVWSAARTADPTLALALWLLLPVGFAAIGLLQLRQGFAFAVMLFVAMRIRRPVIGTLLAAMLHTTFALALTFALVGRLFRDRFRLALAASVLIAFAGAYVGGFAFELFGGRRLLTYSIQEGATSINYVYTGLLCIIPSIYWLLTATPSANDWRPRVLSTLALVHVGATSFTIFSFFMFPLGAGRVGYLTQLMLIPMLSEIRRKGAIGAALFFLVITYLIYLIGKSYQDGVYDLLLRG